MIGSGKGCWDYLLQRPYRFPASGGSEQDFSVYVDCGGKGFYFPLGTSDAEIAAAKARQVCQAAVNEGWDAACRQFSRELIVSFEWCMDPVLWTYTTIHTLVGKRTVRKTDSFSASPHRQHVLVIEPDAGIRQSLCWCIDQQEGFAAIPCDSVESCPSILALHKPRMVLLNRNLTGVIDFKFARSKMPTVTYSVHADGNQMFAFTPGGADGYLIKRVKPDRLLEPILKAANGSELMTPDLLARVKYYFQDLLQLRSQRENPALTRLTQRERETLEYLSKGFVDKEIAQAMGISAWTVHGHIKSIFERLQVRTRTEAVIRYLER